MAKAAYRLWWVGARTKGAQSRKFTFKPRRRFFGLQCCSRRPKKLCHQAVGTFALALEVCTVGDSCCFEPRDFRLQRLDLGLKLNTAFPMSTWRLRCVPNLGEINAHEYFAAVGRRARQAKPLGECASSLW
jgi:hypothetical protein